MGDLLVHPREHPDAGPPVLQQDRAQEGTDRRLERGVHRAAQRLTAGGPVMTEYDTGSTEAGQDRSFIVRWIVIGVGLAVGVGLALGLWLGVFSGSGASGAAGIVSGDGYTITRTLTPDQTRAILAEDKSQDGQMAASMISGDAAAGIKGTQAEAAVGISDTGKTLLPPLLAIA